MTATSIAHCDALYYLILQKPAKPVRDNVVRGEITRKNVVAENTAMWTSTTNDHSARKDSAEDTAAMLSFFAHLKERGYTMPWEYQDGSWVDRHF